MNPNEAKALEVDKAGLAEEGEDIDFDKVYGGLDIDISGFTKSKELQKSYLDIAKDVGKQATKETLIGAGGAYGDLLELAHLDVKELPGQKARRKGQFDILEKMKDPNYKPSAGELLMLSEDDDLLPETFGLPTSENLRDLNDFVGGPGEPETAAGKYAARSGKFYGQGLAFGQVNPGPAVAAGVAGQAVEDAGGGPLLQAAAEITALLATPGGGTKKLLSSNKKEVAEKINQLRKLGYTEEDITLAINSAYKDSKTARLASKGKKTEKAFENLSENSDKIVKDILAAEIPGIERGTQHVHDLASDFYGAVAQEGANLTITNSKPFLDATKRVVDRLQNTLGKNPEAQAFIQRISEAAKDATQFPSAEKMMNFYKELNTMGKWIGRNERDRLITMMKDGIKDTFRSEGKRGKEFAEKFEKANLGIKKAYDAQEVHDLIQKVSTQDGIDYKRFRKLFDKQDNVNLFKDVLGAEQTKNLSLISKVGSEVKDFDKSWKAANAFKGTMPIELLRSGAAAYYIYKGDWKGLALVAGTKLGTAAIKKIAEKSITDPKFQNLIIKGLHAVKVESPKIMKSVNESMKEYLKLEGIDLDDIE
jgi:hypothetical protein